MSVAFSPCGRILGSVSDRLKLWDVATGRLIRTHGTRRSGVDWLSFSGDGRLLATGGRFGLVALWDLTTARQVCASEQHYLSWLTSLSPDRRVVAVGRYDGEVILRRISGLGIGRLKGHKGALTAMSFSRDGRLLGTSGDDRTARIWDVATQRQIQCFPDHRGGVCSLSFDPSGRVIVSGSEDGAVCVRVCVCVCARCRDRSGAVGGGQAPRSNHGGHL